VQPVERKRVIAEVEVGLGFETVLISPGVLDVSEELPHAIVTVVDATDRCERRMELDARISVCDERIDVACVVRLDSAAQQLDVALRHFSFTPPDLGSLTPPPRVAR
jgi:hypothetical protein